MADRTSTLTLLAKDAASGPIHKVDAAMGGLHQSAGKLGSVMQGIGVGIGVGIFNAAAGAIGNLVGGIKDLISGSISAAGQMERFGVQLEVLLGSEEAAAARLKELVEFAKTTPFDLPGVIEASRTLQVFTQGALATGDGLTMVGDIAAGTGQEFSNVALWVGRLYDAMQSGRPFGEAAARLQEMGAMSGASRGRIEELAKGVKSGAITMADAWAEVGGQFKQFAGLMDKQNSTLEGMLSNLGDTVGQALAGIGEALLPLAKEVVPQIMAMVESAGNSIAGFIRNNYEAIRSWVLGIVSFIGGLVSALFGTAPAVTALSSSISSATPAIGALVGKTDAATGSSKAATSAFKKEIEHLDQMTESVKKLDAAQDARFKKEIARLIGVTDAQVSAIDAADRQRSIDEQRASILRDIVSAERDLAAVGVKTPREAAAATWEWADAQTALNKAMEANSPDAIASAQRKLDDLGMQSTQNAVDQADQKAAAQQRLDDVRARSAEFELDQTDDTRKAQLDGVKAYIEAIAKAEEEWASKKGLLEKLKKDEAILNAGLVAAQESGNLMAVADLTLQLEAVKAAERRTQMAQANEERTKEYEDQKARLQDLVKAAGAAGSGMGAAITSGAVTGKLAIKDMVIDGTKGFESLGDVLTKPDTGLIGAMNQARDTGIKFGDDLRTAITGISGAITGLIRWIGEVKQGLDDIAKSDIWKALNEKIDIPAWLSDPKNAPAAAGIDRLPNFFPPRGLGGPVTANTPYLVGERGPELFMPSQSGTIIPNGVGGTINATFNISGADDPDTVARRVMQALKREQLRQGMAF